MTVASSVGPVRTCIGCRQRAADSELLRVVTNADTAVLVPDPRRQLPGRGAWLHRSPDCLQTALRRRAFERALRRAGPLDGTSLRDYLDQGSSPTAG